MALDQLLHTILQTAGMGGVLAVICYMMIVKVMPKILEDHKAELKDMHGQYQAQILSLTNNHKQELAEQRDRYHTLLDREHKTFQDLMTAIDTRNTSVVKQLSDAMAGVQRHIEELGVLLHEVHQTVRECCFGRMQATPPTRPQPKPCNEESKP